MTITKKHWIFIVIIIVIIVWAILTWFVFKAPTAASLSLQAGVNATNTATAAAVPATSTQAIVHPASATHPTSNSTPAPAAIATHGAMSFTAPTANAQWVFEQQNAIQWGPAANMTGGIYLVNATDGTVVGWILQQTGPNQTSFAWNTRDLLESRTSPTKITVPAGTYVIKIMFDSPQDPTITSAPFSVIYPNQVQVSSYTATIANATFAPASVTVKRGSKITITNDDSKSYQVLVSGYSPFTIAAGASYTFDTTSLSPAPYSFYSSSYPSLRMTVTVQ